MRRLSPWLVLVIFLLGALIVREPRLQQWDDVFLSWFMQNSGEQLPPARVTLVEIGRDDFRQMTPPEVKKPAALGEAEWRSLSPLEYALFIQAVLDFEPAVIGFEPIIIWRDRDKAQEQVFLDQAMRVPKLLVAMELGEIGPHTLAAEDVPSFSQVTGPRGGLAKFAGVSHRPDDEIRLISTPGFINPSVDQIRVPMLFEYRGEIVPSFPLQAIILWLRATPSEVKIKLGSRILLPNGWTIPIHQDGTTTINPAAAGRVRRVNLNQLLLAAQERESHRAPTNNLSDLKDQIVLIRVAGDPLQPPNNVASAIATIQSNAYVHRAPWIYDWLVILAAVVLSFFLWRISKGTLLLSAIALCAGYALLALTLLAQRQLWLPIFLPLVLLLILIVVRLVTSDAVRPAS